VRRAGAIDLQTIQRYVNFWFSSSLDLFGSESSSNAALYFAAGLKGRPNEAKYEDHLALGRTMTLDVPDRAGGVRQQEVPLRNAMNEATRMAYVEECQIFLDRWNDSIRQAGFAFRYRLPSPRFRRSIGLWAGVAADLDGRPISPEAFEAARGEWLPTEADRAFVQSLMQPVTAPGRTAGWIAPPDRGINKLPVDYEYVRLS
jgi:benzoyl-CoA 2,3-dioxygenase component B